MNRQDFDKWKEEEAERRYPVKTHATPEHSPYILMQQEFVFGADAAYNLLSDPDYSQEQELKELHSIVENLKRENEYWRKRCEAAEAVLKDLGIHEDFRLLNPEEAINLHNDIEKWQQSINYDKE